MNIIKTISFSIFFLMLRLDSSVNHANKYEQKIEKYELKLENHRISQSKRIKTQNELLDLYWFSPNRKLYFQKIHRLCLDMMHNHNKGYAPYILGEIYYYGYGVNFDLELSKSYFQQYIASGSDEGYKNLSCLMISQIESYARINNQQAARLYF